MGVVEDAVKEKLSSIYDPELGSDIVSLGMVRDAFIADGVLRVSIALTISGCPMRAEILRRVREEFDGLEVKVQWSEMDADMRKETMKRARKSAQARAEGTKISESTYVVAIASGKGGVGKSTVAADLCGVLNQRGYRVGLLDADVWGHSAPIITGEEGSRLSAVEVSGENLIQPLEHDGIQIVSVGLMLDDPDASLMWRGAMLGKAVEQMLRDVNWDSKLNYLIVDMPPGTGDVMMTISRLLSKTQIYLVTSPTALSSKVAQRLWDAALKSGVRVVGVVENMSYLDVSTKEGPIRVQPFGHGGGQDLAERVGVSVLAQIPIGSTAERLDAVGEIADDIERRMPVAGRHGCAADMLKRVQDAFTNSVEPDVSFAKDELSQ